MTKELAAYISEVRKELQSKIRMLEPSSEMSPLQVRRAGILAAECQSLDACIAQFTLSTGEQGRRAA